MKNTKQTREVFKNPDDNKPQTPPPDPTPVVKPAKIG